MGALVGIVLFQIAQSYNPEYQNLRSALPKDLRTNVPQDISLLTNASDYNLSVKLYRGLSDTNRDTLLLLLENKGSKPIHVSLARANIFTYFNDSEVIFDYPMIGDGTPLTRRMTPDYGESYEIQSKGSLGAFMIDSLKPNGFAADVIYCIKSEHIIERHYCKDNEKENQFISYTVTTPIYDLNTGSTRVIDNEWGYPNIGIASDLPHLPADYAYMYAYESDVIQQNLVKKLREQISLLVSEWKNDAIIYHATASPNVIIQGSFNHFPIVYMLKNVPEEPEISYIFVILKYKPDEKMVQEIDKIMQSSNYALRGSGEGMVVRIN